MQQGERYFTFKGGSRHSVDEISSSVKSLPPKFQWHFGLRKKRKTGLHNVYMFRLNMTILSRGIGTCKLDFYPSFRN